MKRFMLFFFVSFILVNAGRADYNTPGTSRSWNLDSLVANSAGAVTFSSGSYYFNSNILVSDSDTLKILNNVIVKFDSAKVLNIHGVLIIRPQDSVVFTAMDINKMYVGIRFDTSNASVVKKLTMEYANSIRLYGSNILIDSCTFRNNTYWTSSLASGTVYLFGSNPVISNCKFTGSYRSAINSGANIPSSPTIINNIFWGNNISNYNTPQINMGATAPQPVIIRGNTFLRSSTNSGAIAFLPVGTVSSLIIENNIIKYNRFGIALLAGGINAYINNNIIDSNNIQGSPSLGGSGLNFAGNWSTSSVIVTRNKIRWNLWGITIQNSSKPNLGSLISADTTDVGLNVIYGNSNNGHFYDVYNNTHDSIKAQNNFWGTTNTDSIKSHIIDKFDVDSLGVVDFMPIAGPTAITYNPVVVDSYEFLDVYPNPFNPEVNIKFRIKNDGVTRIRIYDLLGREVFTVANEFLKAGEYEKNWISKGLPSSVYIIRLETSTSNFAKRVAIVK
jgi:hypothetical protein